jgi:hypothetical protein
VDERVSTPKHINRMRMERRHEVQHTDTMRANQRRWRAAMERLEQQEQEQDNDCE